MSAPIVSCGSAGTREPPLCPKKRGEVAPRRKQGANESDFSIFGKGKRVFHVDAEIAHCILDLAMTEKDLDGAEVAGRPVYDRSLRSAKRVRTILASHQTDAGHPFTDKPCILAGAEMPTMINPAGKNIVVHRAAPPRRSSHASRLVRASGSNSNWTGRPVFCCTTIARVRICPPLIRSRIFICTRSQPRSLLSIARSNRARSRKRRRQLSKIGSPISASVSARTSRRQPVRHSRLGALPRWVRFQASP